MRPLPLPRLGLFRLRLPPIGRWIGIARERRHLSELSDHALRDIGVTREQAIREAARPFWNVPDR
ncbi:MAG TPA: DUF1127 domain-containing protein [Paracoccaceae bacterium]|nr:DUF1127 domain-containing protein [Paracoccaceae bacterium]